MTGSSPLPIVVDFRSLTPQGCWRYAIAPAVVALRVPFLTTLVGDALWQMLTRLCHPNQPRHR